ncbi:MAG: spore germination protein [Paenibacillaceae bacterium]|jgi:spore germination protein KA|nr:spore germination protein [Paenibacillaceae bacterium]
MTPDNTAQPDGAVSAQLADNQRIMDQILEDSSDIERRDFVMKENRGAAGRCMYTDGLVSSDDIQLILQALVLFSRIPDSPASSLPDAEALRMHLLVNASVKLASTINECVDAVLVGDCAVFVDGMDKALIVAARGWEKRGVDEPATESVVRGPRDGFTESIRTNTAHIRRRIRDPELRIESMQIGERTKTDVCILYIKGIVKKGLIEEIRNRLGQIQVDGILESGYIEEFIEDAPLSPFTTIQSTERPDKAAAAILEGRAVILVDNTPFCLIVPTYFWSYFQASDDYYSRYWVGSFFRIIRYIAFVISLMLSSIYIMLVSFHQEMIPTGLALTIASGREVVPFPVLLEALFMELAFELMREAGLRLPKPVGQAVSIVGSLIVGQAAVQAGLVSPFMVIVVAITGISSFAIPNYAASFSIRLIRFPLLIASGTLGLLGFSAVTFALIIHALSLRSFGEPYLSPLTPFRPSDQKDTLLRFPWWSMMRRPQLASGEATRIAKGQRPSPPSSDKLGGASDEEGA